MEANQCLLHRHLVWKLTLVATTALIHKRVSRKTLAEKLSIKM